MEEFTIETKNLTKISDRKLVDNINFTAYSGEIHAIIGSNGEGKTVFAKLLAGVRQKTSGSILINGSDVQIHDIVSAQNLGIYMIQQEQVLFPALTVRDNIISGNERKVGSSRIWAPSKKKAAQICRQYLSKFGLDLDLDAPVSSLSAMEKRIVQLVRALLGRPRVLILDELSSSLTSPEIEITFRFLEELKREQVAIIIITHNYSVLLRYCDRVSIINDGTIIGSYSREEFSNRDFRDHIDKLKMNFTYPSLRLAPGEELVKIDHISGGMLKDVHFSLREGEIIGLAGLVSSGRTSLVKAIMGDLKLTSGAVTFPGSKERPFINIISEMDADMALFNCQSIPFNITASNFKRITRHGFTSNKKMNLYGRHYLDKLCFRNVKPDTRVAHLSTGNKQKLIIARSLFNHSNIYIYNEPTKNLDATSRLELYNILNALILEGATVLLISSDFSELIGMCSRIILLKDGRQIGNYSTNYLSVEALSKELE